MADDLDLLTYEEAVDALNLSQSRAAPNTLEVWVTAVSRRIDALCGPVVVREVADEVHDFPGAFLIPRTQPVSAVSEVTEYNGTAPTALAAEDFPTTTSSYDYTLDTNGVLYRRSGGAASWFASRVVITYDAGRYEDTASVDARFKLCASAILRRLWAREAGAWGRADPFSGEDQGSLGFFTVVKASVEEWLSNDLLEPAIA